MKLNNHNQMMTIPSDFIEREINSPSSPNDSQLIEKLLDEFEDRFNNTYNCLMGGAKQLEKINMDMSNLATDVGFDIYLIYRNFYGDILNSEKDKEAAKILLQMSKVAQEFSNKASTPGDSPQKYLIDYVFYEVDKYASFNPKRKKAVNPTKIFLSIIIALFENLIDSNKT